MCEGKDCKETPKFSITYDVGVPPNQILILCDKHYNSNDVFHRNIIKIEDVK